MRLSKVVGFAVLVAVSCFGQERFETGDLKGFTKSPLETDIISLEKPFVVHSIEGYVLIESTDQRLLEVIFEVRGPGKSEKIRAATTDEKGRFRIKGAPEGTYKFKATKDGFQSVVGAIVVGAKVEEKEPIKIEMLLGR
jgi:hypothetical protein